MVVLRPQSQKHRIPQKQPAQPLLDYQWPIQYWLVFFLLIALFPFSSAFCTLSWHVVPTQPLLSKLFCPRISLYSALFSKQRAPLFMNQSLLGFYIWIPLFCKYLNPCRALFPVRFHVTVSDDLGFWDFFVKHPTDLTVAKFSVLPQHAIALQSVTSFQLYFRYSCGIPQIYMFKKVWLSGNAMCNNKEMTLCYSFVPRDVMLVFFFFYKNI